MVPESGAPATERGHGPTSRRAGGGVEYLGLVSRGKRPGNRLWELLRAGRPKDSRTADRPYVPLQHGGRRSLGEAASRERAERGSAISLGQLGTEDSSSSTRRGVWLTNQEIRVRR